MPKLQNYTNERLELNTGNNISIISTDTWKKIKRTSLDET